MRRLMMIFILFLGILLLAMTAHAVPHIYYEGPNQEDDLKALLGEMGAIPFGDGVNRVIGATRANESEGNDWDSFAFTIPSGMQLTQVTYAYSFSGSPGSIAFILDNGNLASSAPFLGEVFINFGDSFPYNPQGNAFGTSLPLGPGTYGMENFMALSDDWTATYEWSFTVDYAPVPEPATMLLLASGLVGLAGIRRRFRK